MAFKLNGMAKEAYRKGEDEMGAQLKCWTDDHGRFAIHLLDGAANVWKKIVSWGL
jgi:hypothetical protein